MQILDRAKLWKEGMMDQIKREITIMKDLREPLALPLHPVTRQLFPGISHRSLCA